MTLFVDDCARMKMTFSSENTMGLQWKTAAGTNRHHSCYSHLCQDCRSRKHGSPNRNGTQQHPTLSALTLAAVAAGRFTVTSKVQNEVHDSWWSIMVHANFDSTDTLDAQIKIKKGYKESRSVAEGLLPSVAIDGRGPSNRTTRSSDLWKPTCNMQGWEKD